MLRLSIFLVLIINTFTCLGQVFVNPKLIIREIEYIHQLGPNSSASLQSFFKNTENHDTILQITNELLSAKGYISIEEKEANISGKSRSIGGLQAPKFKPSIPKNASAENDYCFIQVIGKDMNRIGKTIPTTYTFRYAIVNRERVVAEESKEITLRQKHLEILKDNWMTTSDFIHILQTGLTSLFGNKSGIDFIYPKQFNAQQLEQLNQHFAGYKIAPFDADVHLLQLKLNDGGDWKINPTKEKYTCTDKNVGGDMGSGILTGVLGIGTTTSRKLIFEDVISTHNITTGETVTVKLLVGGERIKEKEGIKNSDRSRSVESSFTFFKKPALTSYGEMSINGDSIALFKYVPTMEVQQIQQKTSGLDTLLFAQELKIEADRKAITDEVTANMDYTIKGTWKDSSFAISNRFSGNLTQYFWKDELVAFSLQNDYEPTLYILKDNQASLTKMLLLQHILSTNLFIVHVKD